MEEAAARFPQRKAYEDETCSMTFSEVRRLAASIGTGIAALENPGRPVAVFMEKSVWMAVSLLGVSCGGCIYCPVDVAMPEARMDRILSVLEPAAVLTSGSMGARAREACGDCPVLLVEDLAARPADEALLASLRARIKSSDPLYILFTSGSTGMPKGVVGTHQTVLNNLEWLASRFDLGPDDVLGNQAPLHFVVADHDLYCPLKFGCSSFFIPAGYFSFPAKLIPLLNQHRVTTVFWVPFALGTIASLRALDEILPEFLRYVFFVGEVMPVRQLNYWREHVPSAHYINLYGSTEMYMCCYYEVDREYAETDTLPIGGPCGGTGILVLDEMDREILPGMEETGELCIRGFAVGPGYYRDPEQTARKFIQNPLEPAAREMIYRTGDLEPTACWNSADGRTTRSNIWGTGSNWVRSKPQPGRSLGSPAAPVSMTRKSRGSCFFTTARKRTGRLFPPACRSSFPGICSPAGMCIWIPFPGMPAGKLTENFFRNNMKKT